MQAENNFESIMDDRIDWRVRLIPEEYRIRKLNIMNLIRQLKNKLKGGIK